MTSTALNFALVGCGFMGAKYARDRVWIRILRAEIRRLHLKDYRRAAGRVHGFVELLSGDVDWPAVMAALRAIRYEGWITAEMIPSVPFYRHAPEVLIHNTARAMDALLALPAENKAP